MLSCISRQHKITSNWNLEHKLFKWASDRWVSKKMGAWVAQKSLNTAITTLRTTPSMQGNMGQGSMMSWYKPSYGHRIAVIQLSNGLQSYIYGTRSWNARKGSWVQNQYKISWLNFLLSTIPLVLLIEKTQQVTITTCTMHSIWETFQLISVEPLPYLNSLSSQTNQWQSIWGPTGKATYIAAIKIHPIFLSLCPVITKQYQPAIYWWQQLIL